MNNNQDPNENLNSLPQQEQQQSVANRTFISQQQEQSNQIDQQMQDQNQQVNEPQPPVNPFRPHNLFDVNGAPIIFNQNQMRQQIENLPGRRSQEHQFIRRSNQLLEGSAQIQQQPATSKKRNFRKLLEMDSQIPQNQYFPDQNHFQLVNQFKRLKLSHNQELRQQVLDGELQHSSFQISFRQQLSNQLIRLNNNSAKEDEPKDREINFDRRVSEAINNINADQNVQQQVQVEILPQMGIQEYQMPEQQDHQELYIPQVSSLIEAIQIMDQEENLPYVPRSQEVLNNQLQIDQSIQSPQRRSKRLSSLKSRGQSFLQENDNDMQMFREDDFSEFIIPKVHKVKAIQLKREKFNLKMKDNCYYKILKEQDPKVDELPIRDLHKLLKHRTQVQFSMKVKIIELRFGKYGYLSPIRLSITNIAKRVSIARSTVYKIIQNYVDNDGMISALPEKQERKKIIEKTVMDGDQEKHITSILQDPKILREWAHLSLEARCGLLKEKYGIGMSRFTLANCYKKLNIGYLKIHSSFYSARSEEQMVELRVAFIKKIFKFMMEGREIVYMDETSTDCWATRSKIWQPKSSVLPLVVQRTQNKEKNVTIIGAISVYSNVLSHLVTYSTNIETVQDFYKQYDRNHQLFDKVIVMDNHRAHWSEQIQEILSNSGATPAFLPPCSSYFNPIETIWSWTKAKWRNRLLQLQNLNGPLQDWMKDELQRICQSCPREVIQNILRSSTGLMIKYMNQYASDSLILLQFEQWWKRQQEEALRRLEITHQEVLQASTIPLSSVLQDPQPALQIIQ